MCLRYACICLFLIVCFVLIFLDKVCLCSFGCPGTSLGDQKDLELKRSTNLSLSSPGIEGLHHHWPALILFLLVYVCTAVYVRMWRQGADSESPQFLSTSYINAECLPGARAC